MFDMLHIVGLFGDILLRVLFRVVSWLAGLAGCACWLAGLAAWAGLAALAGLLAGLAALAGWAGHAG